MYQDAGSSHVSSNQAHTVHVYRITSSWSEGTCNGTAGSVCWNDQPSKDNTSLASVAVDGVPVGAWRDFSGANVINVVQGWVDGTYTNYGVMVMNDVSNENDDGAHKFYSDDQGSSAPRIWIQYEILPTPTPSDTPSNTPTNTPTATPTSFTTHDTTIVTSKDTHIRDSSASNYTSRNYGVYNRVLAGYYDGWGYGRLRALVEFNLSSIPSNATVTDCVLSAYQDVGAAHDSSNQAHVLHVYRITSSWVEGVKNGGAGSVCWNDQPTKNDTSLASLSVNGLAAGAWQDWSGSALNSIVQGWINGTYANYGVMIMNDVSNETDDGAHKFYSDDMGYNAPKIWIEYTVPSP